VQNVWPIDSEAAFGALPTPLAARIRSTRRLPRSWPDLVTCD
jgi:hypothetical protein